MLEINGMLYYKSVCFTDVHLLSNKKNWLKADRERTDFGMLSVIVHNLNCHSILIIFLTRNNKTIIKVLMLFFYWENKNNQKKKKTLF